MRPSSCALALFFLSLFTVCAKAQDETPTVITDQNRTGDLPFSTSIGSNIEHVDVSSGNLIVNIPIASVPGRGMNFDFSLRYDSRILVVATRAAQLWQVQRANYLPDATSGFAWQTNLPQLTLTEGSIKCPFGTTGGSASRWNNFFFQDSHGAKYRLPLLKEGASCGTNEYIANTDHGPDLSTSGIWAAASSIPGHPPTIILPDGSNVFPGGYSSDTFGNVLATYFEQKDSNGNFQLDYPGGTDTLGRNLITQQNGTNQILYGVTDSSGTIQTYTVNYALHTIATNFNATGTICGSQGCNGVTELNQARNMITSIVLPNGHSYSFVYDNYGGLTSLTLPTGAVITYTWATLGSSISAFRYVSNRTVTNGSQVSTWNFILVSSPSSPSFAGPPMRLTVTDPQSNQSTYDSTGGNLTLVSIYQGSATGNPARHYVTDYSSFSSELPGDINPSGFLPVRITTTLDDGRVAKKESDYDTFSYTYTYCQSMTLCLQHGHGDTLTLNASRGNVKELREFDYGTVPGSYGTGTPGPLLRRTKKTYLHDSNANYLTYNIVQNVLTNTVCDGIVACAGTGDQAAQTQYEYDNYVAGDNPLQTATNAAQHDDTNFSTTFTFRGNPTRVKRWRNTDNSLLTTTYSYDTLGNIRATKDPLGHTNTYDYTDSFANSACPVPTGKTGQAYVSTVTNALSQQIKVARYPCTSLVQAHKDQNDINAGRTGTTYTYDLMNRVLTKILPDGGQTSMTYNDVPPVSSTSSTKITSRLNLVSTTVLDGLGRTTQSQLTSDPQGTILTDTTYDLLGRTATSSNPYRSTSDPTRGVTTYQYDALSRVTKVIPPDGTTTVNNIATTYSGNCTTVTDQAGKSRKSCTDGLGRLVQVFEGPGGSNYETDYAYDVLGNLLTVNQKGNDPNSANWRTRTFTYNSLSQLLSASNPESGSITYSYDSAGNLSTKTSPAPNQTGTATVATTYTYDALNRNTTRAFSDGTTPGVIYTYDVSNPFGLTSTNPVGRLVAAWTGFAGQWVSWKAYSYDTTGRPTQWSCLPSPPDCGGAIAANVQYNLAGEVTSEAIGSVNLTRTYDSASRESQLTSSWVDAQHPATLYTVDPSAGYFPNGALRKATLANGLTESAMYNNRLQPCRLEINSTASSFSQCTDALPSGNVLDFTYGYGSSNNGNLATWSSVGNQTFSRSYGYDSLNRTSTLSDTATAQTCKGLSWIIDPWGNRTDQNVTAGTCGIFHAIVGTNNRFGSPYQYDAAGNMTYDGTHSYTYDAENRIVKVDGGSSAYLYDPDGRRTQKTTGASVTTFLYDLNGNVIADKQGSTWLTYYLYSAGQLLAEYANASTYFVHKDHLGSTRLITKLDKSPFDSLDFLPFGEQIAGDTGTTHKFTGKERDTESGLDNFGARYDSSAMGRFMSPDDTDAEDHAGAPQGLNLYSYVQGNPTNATDPDGHDCVLASGNNVYVKPGSCSGINGGTYVPGAVDPKSGQYDPKTHTLTFTYTPYEGGSPVFEHIGGVYPTHPYPTEFEKFVSRIAVGADNVNAFATQVGLQAATAGLGRGIGLGVEALQGARAARAAEAAVDLENLDNHIVRRMLQGGWTKQDILDAIKNGKAYAGLNKATGGPATEYVTSSGKFVVIDNTTKQVLQVSRPGQLPNYRVK